MLAGSPMLASATMTRAAGPSMSESELARLYEFIEGGYREPSRAGRVRKAIARGLRSVVMSGDGVPDTVDRAAAPDPLRAVYVRADPTFFVPLSTCRNVAVFGFGAGAFDAWQETARQVAADPGVAASDTVLARFAEAYQPETAAELLFSDPEADVPAGSRLWQLRTAEVMYFWPWSPAVAAWPRSVSTDLRLPSYGPLGHRVLELEVWRLRRLVASIQERGYRPQARDHVTGSLLSVDGELRFLIRSGFHRVAVLGALGHEEVPVRFANGVQRLMTLDQLPTWPLVRDGVFTPQLAELLVERLYSEDGSAKARELGLGPKEVTA